MIKPIVSLIFIVGLFLPQPLEAKTLWEKYKEQFITKEGRVVDYYQNSSSHSESMGYGMLLAVAYNDKASFKKMHQWLYNNMHKREDSLIPWLWGKRANGSWGVIDFNNATDGDLLISLALLKAFEKWKQKSYLEEGKKIIGSIRVNLPIEWNGKTLLLASYYGHAHEDSIIMNPSYFLFEAYRKFAVYDDRKFWEKVYKDSLQILGKSSFSDYELPPEWLKLTGSEIKIFESKSTLFYSNAIRVVMNLAISEPSALPPGVHKILNHYDKLGYIPDWVDLDRNSVSLAHGSPGFYAVFGLAAKKLGRESLSEKLFKEAKKRLEQDEKSYYSFSLYLLSITEDAFY